MSKDIYSQSIFMDSGAYSLYGIHVGETKNPKSGFESKRRAESKSLDRVKRKRWGEGDYSFYDLSKGSEFRAYCDKYAEFMKAHAHTDVLFTTVDAIMNPEVSWQVQKYFEQEHGLHPIPVLHGGTPVKYLYRYLESGKYPMLGLGGLGQIMRITTYTPWADEVFSLICPASNNYLPLVRVHGFAMTSWKLMSRYPWWSVDSATWIKLAAYGWIVVPWWDEVTETFRHDRPPIQLNMSRKPTPRMVKFWWRRGVKGPRQMKDRHYDNASPLVKECARRWIEHLGIPMGAFDGPELTEEGLVSSKQFDPEKVEITEAGVTSCFRTRAVVNLHYFKDFERSRPKWPHPLNPEIIKHQTVKYRYGLGL